MTKLTVEIMRSTGAAKPAIERLSKTSTGTIINKGKIIDDVFEGIAQGIRVCGDDVIFNHANKYNWKLPEQKYTIMFGYGRRVDEAAKHLIQNYRHTIIEHQKAKGGYTFCWDGGFYKSLNNYKYHRFGMNSPLNNGVFLNKNSPDDRWKRIQKELSIPLKDWTTDNSHILICTQPDNGYSMNRQSTINLIQEWIPKIRTYTDKKIIIKPHPNGMKNKEVAEAIKNFTDRQDNVEIVEPRSELLQYFEGAQCMITWNSTVAVDSVTFGIPTFSFHDMGFAYDVTDHDLNLFNTPTRFDRDQWLADIHYAQWSAEELATGELWDKYKKYCSDLDQGII